MYTDRNNLVTLGIQVTQFLDLLLESKLVIVISTENKTELIYPESKIDVGQGINVGPGKKKKKYNHRALNKRRA